MLPAVAYSFAADDSVFYSNAQARSAECSTAANRALLCDIACLTACLSVHTKLMLQILLLITLSVSACIGKSVTRSKQQTCPAMGYAVAFSHALPDKPERV